MGRVRWARLKTALQAPLRRGAWYQVAPESGLEVVLNVEGKPATVPRRFVEIRATPPREWTVLLNPVVAPCTPAIFQHGYLVCPGCRRRVVLASSLVTSQLCPHCHQTFAIAWDEYYLEDAGCPSEAR